jgi:O-methyltransferase
MPAMIENAAGSFVRMLVRLGLRPAAGLPLSSLPVDLRALGYMVEPQCEAALRTVTGSTMLTVERLISLWDQVRYLDRAKIPGAIVECGVWKGGAVALMAEAHKQSGPPRRSLHLFDSFRGLPEPDEDRDGERATRYAGGRAAGRAEAIGKCIGTLDENRTLLESKVGYPPDLLHYHVGWFADTIPPASEELAPIALLRVDGDWYESTQIALRHLYPNVSAGGLVVVDDYGYWPGCRQAVDEFLATLPHPVLLSQIDLCGRYWIKF